MWGKYVESYSEDLYTEAVKDFIAEQNGSNPFFVYYSQWTPHSSLVQPPNVRPDGSDMNYSVCYDAFPDRVQANCSLNNDTRCVFCKQGRLNYICIPYTFLYSYLQTSRHCLKYVRAVCVNICTHTRI